MTRTAFPLRFTWPTLEGQEIIELKQVMVVTDIANIDKAVQAYLADRLVDHAERLH